MSVDQGRGLEQVTVMSLCSWFWLFWRKPNNRPSLLSYISQDITPEALDGEPSLVSPFWKLPFHSGTFSFSLPSERNKYIPAKDLANPLFLGVSTFAVAAGS